MKNRPGLFSVFFLATFFVHGIGVAHATTATAAAATPASGLRWGRTAAEHAGSFLLGAAGGGLLGWGGVALLSKVVTLGTLGSGAVIAGGALIGGYLALKGLHSLYNHFARKAADQNRTNPAVRDGVPPTDGSETRPPPVGDDDDFPVAGGPRLLGISGAGSGQR